MAVLVPVTASAEQVYQAPAAFLEDAFAGEVPRAEFLWIKKEMRPTIDKILAHGGFRPLRVRYWRAGGRTVWILDEIGKYKPITTGIIVKGDAIERLKVLIYRESHGWEVRHDFFTDQFRGLTLDDHNGLNQRIDGISGATLSVKAIRNLARLALYFHDTATQDEN